MSHKTHPKNYVALIIIAYEDDGLTIEEIANKYNLTKKYVEKIVAENCQYGD